jgi:hypothetical protein
VKTALAADPTLVARISARLLELHFPETIHADILSFERVKNAAYWNPRLTITGIAEMGIYEAIERIEKENGGPYPPREEELRGGRPMK